MLHQAGIGSGNVPGGWYYELIDAFDKSLEALRKKVEARWWSRPSVYLALIGVIGTIALATWQGIEGDEGSKRQLPANAQTTTTP